MVGFLCRSAFVPRVRSAELLLRHGRGGGAGNIVGVAALFAQGYAERNRRLLFGEGAELAHEKGTRRINMAHLSFFAYNISYKERIS